MGLAPAYDFSSSVGPRYDKTLILRVGEQRHAHKIGPAQWRAHVRCCGLDSERVLGAVSEVTDSLPDAFPQAPVLAKANDESRLPIRSTGVVSRSPVTSHAVC